MNRIVGLITFVVFVLFVGGGIIAVVGLSTSTGVQIGGKDSSTGVATLEAPFQTQIGFIRNNSPWPVVIKSIDVDDSGASAAPQIFFAETNDEPLPPAGTPLTWTTTPLELPYTLEGGELRYLGFSMLPAPGKIAAFDTVTVKFSGPLDLTFDKSYSGFAVAAAAGDLTPSLLAADPSEDPTSLDTYVGFLRTALQSGDTAQVQLAMGDGATPEEAEALKVAQTGFAADMAIQSEVTSDDAREWTIQFYRTDVAVDGLPPLDVRWKDFRWGVSVAS